MATLYTIGHSRRSFDNLLECLRACDARRLVDVRAVPRSRRHPQFNTATLGVGLTVEGIAYEWLGRVFGGLRKGDDDPRHHALHEPALRAYARHMESAAFARAASALAGAADESRTVLMCAERDPAQCHRSLIADWLCVHGHAVVHLIEPGDERAHRLHPALRVHEGRLRYDTRADQPELF